MRSVRAVLHWQARELMQRATGVGTTLPAQPAGFANLVAQLEAILQRSGNPAGFDAAAWMTRWLNEPNPALGGERPIALLATEGRDRVFTLLAQIGSGAYA
jgi:hypothetical protein